MTVSLRALRREEVESWYEHQRTLYAADLVENDGMPPAAALAKAAEDSGRALPDGFSTPGNVVLAIEEDAVSSPGFAETSVHMGKDLG
jgi:hypothetical protein